MFSFYSMLKDLEKDFPTYSVNLYSEKDSVHLFAALPGVNKDKVEVLYENDILTVNVLPEELVETDEKPVFYIKEMADIKGTRKFTIPNVEKEKIFAKLENGVLHLYLPLIKAEKKTIEIE